MKIKLMFDFCLFLALLFKPTDLQRSSFKDEWVAWNVGQGQWVTHIQGDTCRHYDVGGEISYAASLKKPLQSFCFSRKNEIFISHWDHDHFALVGVMIRWLPRVCWIDIPKWLLHKKSVSNLKNLNIPHCQEKSKINSWRPHFYKNTNESSAVYLTQEVLLPGDSPTVKEKIWVNQLPNLHTTKVLILGHHGSRTSTGLKLLEKLHRLKLAIASARQAKYRHPHRATLQRLQKHTVPVIKTEDWGNIHWFGH